MMPSALMEIFWWRALKVWPSLKTLTCQNVSIFPVNVEGNKLTPQESAKSINMTLQGLSLRAAVYRQTAATVFILLPWMKLFIAASLKICTPLLSTDSGILCSPAKPCIMRFPSTQLVTLSFTPLSHEFSHTFSKRLLSIFSSPTCSLERRSHTLCRSRTRAHKTTLHDRRSRRALSKLDLRHYRRLLHDSTASLTDPIFDLRRGASFVWA